MKAKLLATATLLLTGTACFAQAPSNAPNNTPGANGTPGDSGGVVIKPTSGSGTFDNGGMDTTETVTIKNPNDEEYNRAVAAFNGGRLQDAVRYGENVLKHDKKYSDAHMLLGYAYLRQSRYADAVPHLTEAVKKDGKNVGLHDALGTAYLQTGKPADAAAQFKAALALAPTDAPANAGLAQTGTASGADPIVLLQKAAASAPSVSAYVNVANALQKAGRLAEAGDAATKAADLAPTNGDLRLFAGGLYAQAGSKDKAVSALQQALALKTEHAYEAHRILANIYGTGERDKAIAEYRQATQLNASDPTTFFNLAVLEAQAGQNVQAKADYQKVLDLKPSDPQMAADARKGLDALK